MLTKRERYIYAFKCAEQNCENDRDPHYGLDYCDVDLTELIKYGITIEMCAVNDYLNSRYCPPK